MNRELTALPPPQQGRPAAGCLIGHLLPEFSAGPLPSASQHGHKEGTSNKDGSATPPQGLGCGSSSKTLSDLTLRKRARRPEGHSLDNEGLSSLRRLPVSFPRQTSTVQNSAERTLRAAQKKTDLGMAVGAGHGGVGGRVV